MNSFLDSVAQHIFNRFCLKNGIADNKALTGVTVVFPNRRASGFFNTSLLQCSDSPFFAPSYSTIQDLFNSLSELKQLDDIRLVCRLHEHYCKSLGSSESLDSFWPWGEILLRDFDDIDSQMVPAATLFSNLNAVKEQASDLTYLTSEQTDVLKNFFHSFKQQSEIKDNFVKVWNKLFDIYSSFTDSLLQDGCGYPGMIQRNVAQSLKDNTLCRNKRNLLDSTVYVFVGFNKLEQSEKILFDYLKQNGNALFYWDYSNHYVGDANNEAGCFIKENMSRYPAPQGFECTTLIPQIKVVSTKSNYNQASYIQKWLDEIDFESNPAQTDNAVVLCNSNLLLHVIHSLDARLVPNTNITMGYPLTQTGAYTFIRSLLELQEYYSQKNDSFRLKYVVSVLSVPFISSKIPEAVELRAKLLKERAFYPSAAELLDNYCAQEQYAPLRCLWRKTEGTKDLLEWLMESITVFAPNNNALDSESVYRIYTIINRLCGLAETDLKELSQASVVRLLEKMMFSATVPFHGDPIHGLQIMGMLETRNLDFRNVLILGANDNELPGFSESPSFIPFSLRKAFGMNTFLDSNAIAAYNFYHLLSRAESVTIMYNSNTEGVSPGQPSRYLLQLQVEWQKKIGHYHIESEIIPSELPGYSVVERSAEITRKIIERFDKSVSPSAIKTYLKCSMQFYFRFVLGISETPDADTDINPLLSGELFHKTMELIYASFGMGIVNKDQIQSLLQNKSVLDGFIDQAFREIYFKSSKVTYNGPLMIEKTKLRRLVKNQLELDLEYAPFEYIASEKFQCTDFEIDNPLCPGEPLAVKVGGVIDRLDLKDGTVRIVDYKTGKPGSLKLPDSIEKLIEDSKKADSSAKAENILQIILYAYILDKLETYPNYDLSGILFYPLKHDKKQQLFSLAGEPVKDMREYIRPFKTVLGNIISEIYSANGEGFRVCPDKEQTSKCKYCAYKVLCER